MIDLKTHLEKFSGNKVLMTVYSHPDDETVAAGGLLLFAKKLGWKTVVVCLTKGGAGKMHINSRGKSTKEIREQELLGATKRLKVDEAVVGDFVDGSLRETKERWQPWVLEIIKKYRPGIVVTYDRSGMTGHPDHISLSIALEEIISRLANRPKVFWTSMPESLRNKMVPDSLWEYVSVPNMELSLGKNVFYKWLAAKAHRSQGLGSRFLLNWREWYYEVDFKKDYPHKYIEFKI